MQVNSAVKAIIRCSGEGCEAALIAAPPGPHGSSGPPPQSPYFWHNPSVSRRDTSVTVELRQCEEVARAIIGAPPAASPSSPAFDSLLQAAIGEASLSIALAPRIPRRSFPTACICSITAVTQPNASTNNASSSSTAGDSASSSTAQQHQMKDVVVREWVLLESRMATNTYATQISVRTLRNISSLVNGGGSESRESSLAPSDGSGADASFYSAASAAKSPSRAVRPPSRIFLTLRFVGCCDQSDAHAIDSLSLRYVFSGAGKEMLAEAAQLIGAAYYPQLTPPHPTSFSSTGGAVFSAARRGGSAASPLGTGGRGQSQSHQQHAGGPHALSAPSSVDVSQSQPADRSALFFVHHNPQSQHQQQQHRGPSSSPAPHHPSPNPNVHPSPHPSLPRGRSSEGGTTRDITINATARKPLAPRRDLANVQGYNHQLDAAAKKGHHHHMEEGSGPSPPPHHLNNNSSNTTTPTAAASHFFIGVDGMAAVGNPSRSPSNAHGDANYGYGYAELSPPPPSGAAPFAPHHHNSRAESSAPPPRMPPNGSAHASTARPSMNPPHRSASDNGGAVPMPMAAAEAEGRAASGSSRGNGGVGAPQNPYYQHQHQQWQGPHPSEGSPSGAAQYSPPAVPQPEQSSSGGRAHPHHVFPSPPPLGPTAPERHTYLQQQHQHGHSPDFVTPQHGSHHRQTSPQSSNAHSHHNAVPTGASAASSTAGGALLGHSVSPPQHSGHPFASPSYAFADEGRGIPSAASPSAGGPRRAPSLGVVTQRGADGNYTITAVVSEAGSERDSVEGTREGLGGVAAETMVMVDISVPGEDGEEGLSPAPASASGLQQKHRFHQQYHAGSAALQTSAASSAGSPHPQRPQAHTAQASAGASQPLASMGPFRAPSAPTSGAHLTPSSAQEGFVMAGGSVYGATSSASPLSSNVHHASPAFTNTRGGLAPSPGESARRVDPSEAPSRPSQTPNGHDGYGSAYPSYNAASFAARGAAVVLSPPPFLKPSTRHPSTEGGNAHTNNSASASASPFSLDGHLRALNERYAAMEAYPPLPSPPAPRALPDAALRLDLETPPQPQPHAAVLSGAATPSQRHHSGSASASVLSESSPLAAHYYAAAPSSSQEGTSIAHESPTTAAVPSQASSSAGAVRLPPPRLSPLRKGSPRLASSSGGSPRRPPPVLVSAGTSPIAFTPPPSPRGGGGPNNATPPATPRRTPPRSAKSPAGGRRTPPKVPATRADGSTNTSILATPPRRVAFGVAEEEGAPKASSTGHQRRHSEGVSTSTSHRIPLSTSPHKYMPNGSGGGRSKSLSPPRTRAPPLPANAVCGRPRGPPQRIPIPQLSQFTAVGKAGGFGGWASSAAPPSQNSSAPARLSSSAMAAAVSATALHPLGPEALAAAEERALRRAREGVGALAGAAPYAQEADTLWLAAEMLSAGRAASEGAANPRNKGETAEHSSTVPSSRGHSAGGPHFHMRSASEPLLRPSGSLGGAADRQPSSSSLHSSRPTPTPHADPSLLSPVAAFAFAPQTVATDGSPTAYLFRPPPRSGFVAVAGGAPQQHSASTGGGGHARPPSSSAAHPSHVLESRQGFSWNQTAAYSEHAHQSLRAAEGGPNANFSAITEGSLAGRRWESTVPVATSADRSSHPHQRVTWMPEETLYHQVGDASAVVGGHPSSNGRTVAPSVISPAPSHSHPHAPSDAPQILVGGDPWQGTRHAADSPAVATHDAVSYPPHLANSHSTTTRDAHTMGGGWNVSGHWRAEPADGQARAFGHGAQQRSYDSQPYPFDYEEGYAVAGDGTGERRSASVININASDDRGDVSVGPHGFAGRLGDNGAHGGNAAERVAPLAQPADVEQRGDSREFTTSAPIAANTKVVTTDQVAVPLGEMAARPVQADRGVEAEESFANDGLRVASRERSEAPPETLNVAAGEAEAEVEEDLPPPCAPPPAAAMTVGPIGPRSRGEREYAAAAKGSLGTSGDTSAVTAKLQSSAAQTANRSSDKAVVEEGVLASVDGTRSGVAEVANAPRTFFEGAQSVPAMERLAARHIAERAEAKATARRPPTVGEAVPQNTATLPRLLGALLGRSGSDGATKDAAKHQAVNGATATSSGAKAPSPYAHLAGDPTLFGDDDGEEGTAPVAGASSEGAPTEVASGAGSQQSGAAADAQSSAMGGGEDADVSGGDEVSVWCLKHHARTVGSARRILDLRRCADVPSSALAGVSAPRVLMCMRHVDGTMWTERGGGGGDGMGDSGSPFVELSEGTCALIGARALSDGAVHQSHVRDARRCVVIRQATRWAGGGGRSSSTSSKRSRSSSVTAQYYDNVVAAFELTSDADCEAVHAILRPFILSSPAAEGVANGATLR